MSNRASRADIVPKTLLVLPALLLSLALVFHQPIARWFGEETPALLRVGEPDAALAWQAIAASVLGAISASACMTANFYSKFRDTGVSPWSLVPQASMSAGGIILPLNLISLSVVLPAYHFYPGAVAYFVVIGAVVLLLEWIDGLQSRQPARVVLSGKIAERAARLAGRRSPEAVWVLSTRRWSAPAAVEQDGNIVLSERLLKHLNDRELDAVIARQVQHEFHDTILWSSFLYGLIYLLACPLPTRAFIPATVAMCIAQVAGMAALVRSRDRLADARAVEKTGDPEAFVSALGTIQRLYDRPSGFHLLPTAAERVAEAARTAKAEPAAVI